MSNFEKAITVALASEGGYVNNPADPGGETKYGITKRTYPELDIKNLTIEQAKAIYKRDWWAPYKYDLIKSDDVATKIFDTSINTGAKRAFRFAQQAANDFGAGLVEDGVLGNQSVSKINEIDSEAFLSVFRKIQADYYKGLVAAKPSLGQFLRGWLIRAQH